ncbi:MAG: hypothetical protein A3C47_02760 [Omnitrophica bacterium RIFCSPHIGHO2_02_FULL_51_18]|nr:MAG: hypothetical protein A3C47_02760 [Omnitrophica bacterium RIFCSPHIGHO2_02_FULL_51_18]
MLKRVLSVLVLAGIASVGFQTTSYADAELDGRIREARLVLNEIMAAPDHSIPEELFAKCKAIAIYPNVLKAGFIIGGRFGKGVVLSKDANGKWGPVAFSTIGGGSWGLQIGGSATDLILVIMNERGMDGLLSSNFKLGADAAVAAGPIGRTADASTDLTLKAGVLAYSRSRGLFAGIALDGAVLTEDNNSNTIYYGKPMTSREILISQSAQIQPSSKELIDTLNDYSARWPQRTGK